MSELQQDLPSGDDVPEGPVERFCKLASAAALLVLMGVVGVDIVTRWFLNFSFEISDEIGAYMLVAITFLSLSVSQVFGAFHRVEFIQMRLSPVSRTASRVLFDVLSLAVSLILLWQFIRLVMSSWRFDDHAPTFLETPLWIPRMLLVIGMAALCVSLCRSLVAGIRRLASQPGTRNGS